MNRRIKTAKLLWGVLLFILFVTFGDYLIGKMMKEDKKDADFKEQKTQQEESKQPKEAKMEQPKEGKIKQPKEEKIKQPKEAKTNKVSKDNFIKVNKNTRIYVYEANKLKNQSRIAVKTEWLGMGLSTFCEVALPQIRQELYQSIQTTNHLKTLPNERQFTCLVTVFQKDYIVISYGFLKPQNKAKHDIKPEENKSSHYILKADGDTVTAYVKDLEHVLFVTDLRQDSFSDSVWDKLILGIDFEKEIELYNFLESYSS